MDDVGGGDSGGDGEMHISIGVSGDADGGDAGSPRAESPTGEEIMADLTRAVRARNYVVGAV